MRGAVPRFDRRGEADDLHREPVLHQRQAGRCAGGAAAEPDGPEVIVISPKECHGWLEKTTMGAFRDSAFRQLLAADTHRRLRLVYPAASRARDVPTFVHSKVMIVDDELVRIGSANFSHRSMGMDTECDLAVEAGGDSECARAFAGFAIGCSPSIWACPSTPSRARSSAPDRSARFIDTRQTADHTLVRIEMPATEHCRPQRRSRPPPIPTSRSPSGVGRLTGSGRRRGRRAQSPPPLDPAVCCARGRRAVASAGRTQTLDSMPVALASLVARSRRLRARRPRCWFRSRCWPLPRACVSAPCAAVVVALTGSLVAAVVGYVAGRAIGPARLPRWMSRRSYRSISQLECARRGGRDRAASGGVASAGAIHLLCGAGRVPFAAYMAGTALASRRRSPRSAGWAGCCGTRFCNPSISNGLIDHWRGRAPVRVASGLRAFLLIRQFAPSVSGHRGRAEFG